MSHNEWLQNCLLAAISRECVCVREREREIWRKGEHLREGAPGAEVWHETII
jgi:hypothetical protein